MTRKIVTGIAVALLLLGAAFVLLRGRNRRNATRMFIRLNPLIEVLDRDEDSTLSASEIATAPSALKTLDSNHDGSLTEDELLPRPGRSGRKELSSGELARELMAFDRNQDKHLSPDELPERMQGLFTRGDRNHDGLLDESEVTALADLTAATSARAEYWPGNFMTTDPVAAALDTDHNQILSSAEIAAAPTTLLTLDRNHDGQLTLEELRPARR